MHLGVKETEVQLLKDKQKELEFMNAMLSDRLALAQRRRFGSSSEKYTEGETPLIKGSCAARWTACFK